MLNPVRRVRHSFIDFASRHIAPPHAGVPRSSCARISQRLHLPRRACSRRIRTNCPAACASASPSRWRRSAGPNSSSPTNRPPRSMWWCRRACSRCCARCSRRWAASLLLVTHDLTVHATLCDRLGIMYAGRLVEEGRPRNCSRAPRHPYTRAPGRQPAAHRRCHARRASLHGRPPNLADPPPGCRFHPRCPLAMDICRREVPTMERVAPGHRVACFAAAAMRRRCWRSTM